MKLLLTSAGVTNASIRDALVDLLGKPIEASTALCIPTAQYGHPMVGSMVMTPAVGEDFIQWRPPNGDETTLGVVDFSICPHLAADGKPGNSMAEAEQWAAGISNPAYAIDD